MLLSVIAAVNAAANNAESLVAPVAVKPTVTALVRLPEPTVLHAMVNEAEPAGNVLEVIMFDVDAVAPVTTRLYVLKCANTGVASSSLYFTYTCPTGMLIPPPVGSNAALADWLLAYNADTL